MSETSSPRSPVRRGLHIMRRDTRRALGEPPIPHDHDLIICSPGGCGTSVFLEFFRHHRHTNWPLDGDGFKHRVQPPHLENPETKVIFMYSDPTDAVISLYARGYADAQSLKLGSRSLAFPATIEAFAASGRDQMGLTRQFNAWTAAGRDYPVLFVRYETAWEHLDEIGAYAGVSDEVMAQFPEQRERTTDRTALGEATVESLDRIYEPLRRSHARLADVEVR